IGGRNVGDLRRTFSDVPTRAFVAVAGSGGTGGGAGRDGAAAVGLGGGVGGEGGGRASRQPWPRRAVRVSARGNMPAGRLAVYFAGTQTTSMFPRVALISRSSLFLAWS